MKDYRTLPPIYGGGKGEVIYIIYIICIYIYDSHTIYVDTICISSYTHRCNTYGLLIPIDNIISYRLYLLCGCVRYKYLSYNPLYISYGLYIPSLLYMRVYINIPYVPHIGKFLYFPIYIII